MLLYLLVLRILHETSAQKYVYHFKESMDLRLNATRKRICPIIDEMKFDSSITAILNHVHVHVVRLGCMKS